ncbi:hypothetical protein B0T13DRAFT_320697 [Neurospora crassa]|nr:hypothetical protein B0T13DRAFT_320697 [Neurospora crassa]
MSIQLIIAPRHWPSLSLGYFNLNVQVRIDAEALEKVKGGKLPAWDKWYISCNHDGFQKAQKVSSRYHGNGSMFSYNIYLVAEQGAHRDAMAPSNLFVEYTLIRGKDDGKGRPQALPLKHPIHEPFLPLPHTTKLEIGTHLQALGSSSPQKHHDLTWTQGKESGLDVSFVIPSCKSTSYFLFLLLLLTTMQFPQSKLWIKLLADGMFFNPPFSFLHVRDFLYLK